MQKLLQDVWQVFNAEVTGVNLDLDKTPLGKVMPLGKLGMKKDGDNFSLSLAFAEITAKAKQDSRLREQLNRYLAPKKTELIQGINEELLKPASAALQKQGKEGLVTIIDNLDRIANPPKSWGISQQEYLFADQGQFLTQLDCHVVYTMPLSLMYSPAYNLVTQRFGQDVKVLPMVQILERDGALHRPGLAKLQEMALKRACPSCSPKESESLIGEIFGSADLLREMCRLSGGHVRDLLRLLNAWIIEEGQLPLSQAALQKVVVGMRDSMARAISAKELEALREVAVTQRVSDDEGYQMLIRGRYVCEFMDESGSWCCVNPILESLL